MKRVLICYISGTGNTKLVSEEYKKNFEQNGVSVMLFDICQTLKNNGKKIDLEPLAVCLQDFLSQGAIDGFESVAEGSIVGNQILNYLNCFDMLGFAFPIHAFNCPKPFYLFLKALPKGINLPVFVFKTSGEPLGLNGGGDFLVNSALKRVGCDVLSIKHIVMPYNIITRHCDRMVKQMWQMAMKIVSSHVIQLMYGKRQKLKLNIFCGAISAVLRIEWGGARLIGRGFKTTDACVGCAKCASICPTSNIMLKDGKPVFGKNCFLCMRCALYCPKNAVKIGILDNWRVNGGYDVRGIAKNPNIEENYINQNTKGIKKIYKKYFAELDAYDGDD